MVHSPVNCPRCPNLTDDLSKHLSVYHRFTPSAAKSMAFKVLMFGNGSIPDKTTCKFCNFEITTKQGYTGGLVSHHKHFHRLSNDEAMNLIMDENALTTYKTNHGFTETAGVCGKCNTKIVDGLSLAKGAGVKFLSHLNSCGKSCSTKHKSKKATYGKTLCLFCNFELTTPSYYHHVRKVHKFETIADAENVSNNAILLAKWRNDNGYTAVPGQCRRCSDIFGRTKIHRHVESCHQSCDDATLNEPNAATNESDDDEILAESGESNDETDNECTDSNDIPSENQSIADQASATPTTGYNYRQRNVQSSGLSLSSQPDAEGTICIDSSPASSKGVVLPVDEPINLPVNQPATTVTTSSDPTGQQPTAPPALIVDDSNETASRMGACQDCSDLNKKITDLKKENDKLWQELAEARGLLLNVLSSKQ